MATIRHALIVGVALCAGCASTPKDEPETLGNKRWMLKAPPNKTIELIDFKYDWSDLDRDEQGRRDSYQIARWATERHNEAMRCLRQEPPARVQAAKLLTEVLERVPDSSRDLYQLAILRFREAAYWFRAADAIAWQMDYLRAYRRTGPLEKGGRELTEEEVAETIQKGRPALDEANERLKRRALESLRHLDRYRQLRPDDKRILDFIWKLHFYLQNYDQALKWLDYLLAEMDRRGVPEEEPLRKDYVYIKSHLQDFLANLKIQGTVDAGPRGQSVIPWKGKRDREIRERLGHH